MTDEPRRHRCDYAGCPRSFSHTGHLRDHVRRCHTGELPFRCTWPGCSKAFVRRDHLKSHEYHHTGTKPFDCKYPGCKKAFSQIGSLRLHTRCHSGERPYKCDQDGCDKAFAQKGALVMHRRAHLDENPFACPDPDCTMQFRSSTRCREHFARRHSEQGRLRQKREEEKVSACLKSAGIDFAREHFVSFECWKGTFARADFVVLGNGGVVLIEVDEGQHQDYEQLCEVTRMSNIHSAFAVQGNTLPVVFIRYNPHRFSVDTVVQKVSSKDRQAQLVRTIQELEFGEHASLEIVYMYYDTIKEGETLALNIWKDAGYSKTVLECCKCPVI